MGKPIAGRGQYPFQINGVIVDGAKINGKTFIKELFLYKQRSYNEYDLIDAAGNVYEYVSITWAREDGVHLNYFDNSAFSVELIKENTFFIKIQDVPRDIYGFITLIQSNKIKVNTGDYIFFSTEDDYSLLSVRLVPETIQASVGQTVTVGVQFLPDAFENKTGVWGVNNDAVVETTRSISSFATFQCTKEGHSTVTFNPNANSKLTATAHIFVTESIPSYSSFVIMQNNPTGLSTVADDTYFPGDEIMYTAIFNPFSYEPETALSVSIDESVLEYLGTDDNLNYKFKVLENTTFSSVRTRVTLSDGKITASDSPIVRQKTSSLYVGISPVSGYGRPGEQYQFSLPYYSSPLNPNYTFSVEKPALGTINSNGLLTVNGTGSQKIYLNANGGNNVNYTYIDTSAFVPDMYKYFPNDRYTYFVGEQIQLTATTVPSSVTLSGKWRARHDSDSEYFTISSTGLLTILKAPSSASSVFYVGYTYTGNTNIGGTVNNTIPSLEKTFCILPAGTEVKPQSVRIGSFATAYTLPVGGKSSGYVSMSPRESTGDKSWTMTIADPTIVSVDYDPYFNNNYYMTDFVANGLKRGQTEVTITSVQDPTVTVTYTFTVY